MEFSGPATLSDLEEDLALSEDDSYAGAFPALPRSQGQASPSAVCHNKRRMDDMLASHGESPSPPAKPSKHRKDSDATPAAPQQFSHPLPLAAPLPPSPRLVEPSRPPAFAPREDYVRLLFPGRPSVDTKLRWLAEVNRAFNLDRQAAVVKMSAVSSRFVYVSRQRMDIVEKVTAGEFLSLRLDVQDSPVRNAKLPSYLLTRYPECLDPSLAKEHPGVYSARRFFQNGKPINRIVIVWCHEDPPPAAVSFTFLPCLPPCAVRPLHRDQPSCYRCWGVGHISRYCSAPERCAWCAGEHDSRTCPHRAPPPTVDDADPSTSSSPPDAPPLSSKWKCPRCHEPGVSVWHGCPRPRSLSQIRPPPPPPPPSAATPLSASPVPTSPQIDALRAAVSKLTATSAALAARLDAIEARMASLANSCAKFEDSGSSMVETQRVVIENITSLTERMETLASTINMWCNPRVPSSSQPVATSSSPPSGRRSAHRTVR